MSSLPSVRPEKGRAEVALPGQQAQHERPQTVYVILDSSAESVNLFRLVHEHHINSVVVTTDSNCCFAFTFMGSCRL